MDLSIVIVNWNTRDFLHHCLWSIAKDVRLAKEYEVETIVVDNASTDGSLQMLQTDFPWVKPVANNVNFGFARANNQGIRQSSGRQIVLLNSDTEVRAGALSTLVDFLDRNRRAGAAGARLLNGDGTLQPGCHPMLTPTSEFWQLMFLEKIWPRSTYPLDEWGVQTPRRVDVIKGACLMLKREALDQIGLLDERYYMYTEEVDLCYRFDSVGWQIYYIPEAIVIHHGGASSRQIAAEMYLQLYRSKIQFFRKFGGKNRALRYKILLGFAYLPRAVLRPKTNTYWRLLAALKDM